MNPKTDYANLQKFADSELRYQMGTNELMSDNYDPDAFAKSLAKHVIEKQALEKKRILKETYSDLTPEMIDSLFTQVPLTSTQTESSETLLTSLGNYAYTEDSLLTRLPDILQKYFYLSCGIDDDVTRILLGRFLGSEQFEGNTRLYFYGHINVDYQLKPRVFRITCVKTLISKLSNNRLGNLWKMQKVEIYSQSYPPKWVSYSSKSPGFKLLDSGDISHLKTGYVLRIGDKVDKPNSGGGRKNQENTEKDVLLPGEENRTKLQEEKPPANNCLPMVLKIMRKHDPPFPRLWGIMDARKTYL